MKNFKRNVPFLAFNQAIMVSGSTMVITTASIVGFRLAADKSLATLPIAALQLFTMLTTIPAALLMERIGRKSGFVIAGFSGVMGGLIASFAILQENFGLFVMASALFGVHNGFGGYFRFAAADSAPENYKSKAISWVLAGGVLAAFLGPNLAVFTNDLLKQAQFAGSYLVLSVFFGASCISAFSLKLPGISNNSANSPPASRSLWVIARQPRFSVALICATLGYASMALVMTATPLAMARHAHPFESAAFVIQWHVVAMFAPSFITGRLITRFGLLRILAFGVLFGFITAGVNLHGQTIWHFVIALVALGLCWNFLFIGGTTLLTETYQPSERAKTQGLNDFLVFTAVAAASLSSGTIQHQFGWRAINLAVIPFFVLVLSAVALLFVQNRKKETPSRLGG